MEQDFTGYEYKRIKVSGKQAALYLDAYECFGWQMDERLSDLSGDGLLTLQLKRDRKLMNRMELTRLQRNFEGCMEEITMLEQEKTRTATAVSIAVGIVGMAFLAGSTFAVTASEPIILLCILLAIPGFAGWILPYFLYRHIVRKKTEDILPMIEKKHDEIGELMKKGHALL